MSEGDTIVNALLGAFVTVVLSFVPVSPLLGGMVAGYLEGGSRDDGLRVGLLSGGIAMVPLLLFVLFVGGLGAVFILGGIPLRAGAVGAVFLVFALAAIAIYTVGLAAIGGWLGNYLKTDVDIVHPADGR